MLLLNIYFGLTLYMYYFIIDNDVQYHLTFLDLSEKAGDNYR